MENKTGMQSSCRVLSSSPSQLFLITQPDTFPLHNPPPYHQQAQQSRRPTDLKWVSSETVTGKDTKEKGWPTLTLDLNTKSDWDLGILSLPGGLLQEKKGCWDGNINRNCSNVTQSMNIFREVVQMIPLISTAQLTTGHRLNMQDVILYHLNFS